MTLEALSFEQAKAQALLYWGVPIWQLMRALDEADTPVQVSE